MDHNPLPWSKSDFTEKSASYEDDILCGKKMSKYFSRRVYIFAGVLSKHQNPPFCPRGRFESWQQFQNRQNEADSSSPSSS